MIIISDAINQLDTSQANFYRNLRSVTEKQGIQITLNDFDRLESSLSDLALSIERTRNRMLIVRPIANLFLPSYTQTLDAGSELTKATQAILEGIRPTLFYMVNGEENGTVVTQVSSGERIIELIDLGSGRFITAQNHLNRANDLLSSIPIQNASSEMFATILDIERFHAQISATNDLLLQLPEVLSIAFGLDEEQRYLILAQNNDEIRPSGGFISTWGWMTVRSGRITDFDYFPTQVDSPAPPSDLNIYDYYPIPEWWLQYENPIYAGWDGSWFADFRKTAEMSVWYYTNGANQFSDIDGVIAIDVTGFQYILEALGDVTVPEHEVIVNSENFREVVYDIRAYGEGAVPHKVFVADLYKTIFEESQNISRNPEMSTAIFGAILQSLREKHIMFYLVDDTAQKPLEILNWSGQLSAGDQQDFVGIFDANLGNKSNSSIIRQLTYDVTINEDNSLNSRVAIKYDYPSALADLDPAVDPAFHGRLNYGNLTQIFLPFNAQVNLESLDPDASIVDIVDHDTHRAIVAFMDIPYDTSNRIQYEYVTSERVQQFGKYRIYNLLIAKQPGAKTEEVEVQVMIPLNATFISATPPITTSYVLEQEIIEFRLSLAGDTRIELIFEME
ncbi:MAG: DUF4012 domain-containing protein [Phototrophicaceae bacterium]